MSKIRPAATGARSSEIDSMECFVYVLGSSCKNGYRTYVGWTTDLDRRLAQHNAGTGARSTRGRVWVVLCAEQHATRREAMRRELHLKRDRPLRRRLAYTRISGKLCSEYPTSRA